MPQPLFTHDPRLPFVPELNEHQRLELQWQAAASTGHPAAFRDALADGSQGPELLVIPAGAFEMGSPPSEFGHRPEEGPQHYHTQPQAYALGRFTVTAEEFARFEAATGWHWRPDLIRAEGRLPVVNIRVAEALAYCHWLSAQPLPASFQRGD